MASRAAVLVWMALLVLAGAAPAAELQPVARHQSTVDATEIEVAGDMAFLTGSAGLEIVSIRDPQRPARIAFYECPGAFDVALDPAAQIAVVAIDQPEGGCMPGEGFVVLDIRNPADPQPLASVAMPQGAHTLTMDGRVLYANQQDETLRARRLEVWSLADPARPVQLSAVEFDAHGPHDSFLRRRADGRHLLYTANIGSAHVLDVTDPAAPRKLQEVRDPRINYAHATEISHDDGVLMISDETLIGSPSGVCGKAPAGPDLGALHFYAAAPDGTFADRGLQRLGTWNVPFQFSGDQTCTIHAFMQSPDSRRVVAAWYKQGTRVADFSDPANVRELGAYAPAGAYARQSIAHNGYVYTADIHRGMEVLRFTGEGWPATAGPAEAFRFGPGQAAAVPAPAPAAAPVAPPRRAAGRARFVATVRVPGRSRRRARVDVTVTDERGVRVGTAAARVVRGRRARVRVELTGLPGRYRWSAYAGRRRLASGRVAIARAQPGLTLPDGQVVRVRVARR